MQEGTYMLEPIGTIRVILEWLAETESATASINYSFNSGWNFTLYMDSGECADLEDISFDESGGEAE